MLKGIEGMEGGGGGDDVVGVICGVYMGMGFYFFPPRVFILISRRELGPRLQAANDCVSLRNPVAALS